MDSSNRGTARDSGRPDRGRGTTGGAAASAEAENPASGNTGEHTKHGERMEVGTEQLPHLSGHVPRVEGYSSRTRSVGGFTSGGGYPQIESGWNESLPGTQRVEAAGCLDSTPGGRLIGLLSALHHQACMEVTARSGAAQNARHGRETDLPVPNHVSRDWWEGYRSALNDLGPEIIRSHSLDPEMVARAKKSYEFYVKEMLEVSDE